MLSIKNFIKKGISNFVILNLNLNENDSHSQMRSILICVYQYIIILEYSNILKYERKSKW